MSNMNYVYKKGEKAYYKTWYGKLKEITIVDRRSLRWVDLTGFPSTRYEYIVRFTNGRLKIVKENKIF